MRFPSLRHLLPALFVALVLSACNKEPTPAPANVADSQPQAALQQSIDLLKAGDLNAFWKHALPPADYATLRGDWNQRAPDATEISAEDRARFDETMRTLAEPDATDKLFAELQPKLVELEKQYKDQLPVLITIGQAFAKSALAQTKSLSSEQQAQTREAIDALGPWLQQTPWFDPAKTREAIGIVVTTGRQLQLTSLEQARTMDFDTAMQKYSLGFAGVKQVLMVYGLSLDDTLNSIKLSPIENNGQEARLRIDYTLFGKPLTAETTLVQQDGHWYSKDMRDNARETHRKLGEPASGAGGHD